MSAYYNEIDPKAAAWLRELIKGGHIAPGDVDERSIEDVRPSDIAGYTQCHFFAGIGGWSYALRLAGWPDDRPVWTGSCPCQPFSAAGKGAGFADERHLWPAWFHLIRTVRPHTIFGEQVASKDGLAWLDVVLADLEGQSYTAWAADMCAAGVGAPHIRQRLYFLGSLEYPHGMRRDRRTRGPQKSRWNLRESVNRAAGKSSELGDTESGGRPGQLVCANGKSPLGNPQATASSVADTGGRGFVTRCVEGPGQALRDGSWRTDAHGGRWRDPEWLYCTDGKSRPVEPGTFPLAHGVPGRVGLLRGYGNAIVPQVAAQFIGAYLDID